MEITKTSENRRAVFVSVAEFARMTGLSRETVRRLCRQDRIPSWRVGQGPRGQFRIDLIGAIRALRSGDESG